MVTIYGVNLAARFQTGIFQKYSYKPKRCRPRGIAYVCGKCCSITFWRLMSEIDQKAKPGCDIRTYSKLGNTHVLSWSDIQRTRLFLDTLNPWFPWSRWTGITVVLPPWSLNTALIYYTRGVSTGRAIDYRYADGRFMMSPHGVTVSKQNDLFSSDTRVNAAIRRWQLHLSESTRCHKCIGGICFTYKWRATFFFFFLQTGVVFDNLKPTLKCGVFRSISKLLNDSFLFGRDHRDFLRIKT
jgi:hypothetical protein